MTTTRVPEVQRTKRSDMQMSHFPETVASRVRQTGANRSAILVVIALVAGLAAAAPAAATRHSVAPCGFVATGAHWTFKGQNGSAYTVIALGGASCSTARKWVPRLTNEHAAFTLKPVPAGWHCSTAGGITTGLTKTGQCTTRGGGIVEWLPKLKK